MPSRQYTNNAVLQTICILQLLLGYETILPALMYRTDTKKASIEPRQSTVSPCHLISTVQSPSVPVLPHQSLSSPLSPLSSPVSLYRPPSVPVVPRQSLSSPISPCRPPSVSIVPHQSLSSPSVRCRPPHQSLSSSVSPCRPPSTAVGLDAG